MVLAESFAEKLKRLRLMAEDTFPPGCRLSLTYGLSEAQVATLKAVLERLESVGGVCMEMAAELVRNRPWECDPVRDDVMQRAAVQLRNAADSTRK